MKMDLTNFMLFVASVTVTSSVRSSKFSLTSIMPSEWFLKTRNWESIRKSTELG